MRSVIYEFRFVDRLAEIQPNFERADAFMQGVEWLLARSPESGTRIAGTDVWCMPAADVFPQALSIFYTFDDKRVWLLSLAVTESDELL